MECLHPSRSPPRSPCSSSSSRLSELSLHLPCLLFSPSRGQTASKWTPRSPSYACKFQVSIQMLAALLQTLRPRIREQPEQRQRVQAQMPRTRPASCCLLLRRAQTRCSARVPLAHPTPLLALPRPPTATRMGAGMIWKLQSPRSPAVLSRTASYLLPRASIQNGALGASPICCPAH